MIDEGTLLYLAIKLFSRSRFRSVFTSVRDGIEVLCVSYTKCIGIW